MSTIVVDQIQKLGGAATFTLPTSGGTVGQYVTTNGSGQLGFTSMTSPYGIPIEGIIAPEGTDTVGAIFSHTDRTNIYSTGEWSTSGPWTTWYAYQTYADNSLIQFVNMALGDGYGASGTSQNMMGADAEKLPPRQVIFSNGNRLGYRRSYFHYDNDTSYTGHSFCLLPIRNTSGSSISVNIYAYLSSYYSSGYDGANLFVLAPNTYPYSAVTSVSSTNLSSIQSSSATSNATGSISIPPYTTVIVCACSSDAYVTTYQFLDTCFFYNLSTTFTNSNIICDMRMLSSLYQSRFNLAYTGAAVNTNVLAPLWTMTATNYGDR